MNFRSFQPRQGTLYPVFRLREHLRYGSTQIDYVEILKFRCSSAKKDVIRNYSKLLGALVLFGKKPSIFKLSFNNLLCNVILILQPNVDRFAEPYHQLISYLDENDQFTYSMHDVQGTEQHLTEIYLLGNTAGLSVEQMKSLPCVDRVVRIQESYRILGRHGEEDRQNGFTYNGVTIDQSNLHVFAGLCAVDNPAHVEMMFSALKDNGQVTSRMGAYKPRSNPYSFQGHGASCLPWVFDLAGKYGIKIIAMEVTHESHVEEIDKALRATGKATGVMLQIGTRNTQNFELLKSVGRQQEYPVLFKRGFGISLNESLNAAEYLASEGNPNVVFALRGMKSQGGDPHRNMVDFAHVPVVKRLTRMPVCVDPSHSVGTRDRSPEGISDVFHATAQGVVAGANMVLVDFHPAPSKALVDGPQALRMNELGWFLEDVAIAREAYEKRAALASSRLEGL